MDTETEKTVVVDVKKTTTKPKKVLTEVPETETTASASKEKNDIAPVEKSVSNIIFFQGNKLCKFVGSFCFSCCEGNCKL